MSIVIRRVPATALLLIAAYAVGVSAPCPPKVEAGYDRGRAETRLVDSHGSHASAEIPVLLADCACGCGKRPRALGGRIGVALATQTVEAVAPPMSDETFDGFGLAPFPDPTVRTIDHVPLPT